MGSAEVISLSDGRASSQWQRLRDDLHARFDQWLDRLQAKLPDPQVPLAEVSEAVWSLRQDLTGNLSETIVVHGHRSELSRQFARCPNCARPLTARRPLVARTVDTLVGAVQVERPYFYCTSGCGGFYPMDDALGLRSGRLQLDVQQAMVDLATEVPYETASAVFGRLTGIGVSSERMHALTNQAAEGLKMLEVAPSRAQIDQLVAQVAKGRFRRPVLVLGVDGAYVPSRPESARGHRPGRARQRARRARWRHEWREAKGFRFYLLDGDRIVHVLSWHQVHNEHDLGEALRQVKEAGLIPAGDGAAVCGMRWRRVDMEAHRGVVSPCLSGARLLPLFGIPPQGGQGAIRRSLASSGMGRGDPDSSVSGQSGAGARWPAADAADFGGGAQGDR